MKLQFTSGYYYSPDFMPNYPFNLYSDAPESVVQKFQDQQKDRDIRTQWDLGDGRFDDKQWYRAFNHLKSLNLKRLVLNSNGMPSIVKNIQTVSMIRMQQLDLENNQIETFENLQLILMPNLQYFKLGKNKITNFSTVKKFIAPFLQVFELDGNQARDLEPFLQIFRLQKSALVLVLGQNQQKKLINIQGLLKKPRLLNIKNFPECFTYQVKSKSMHSIRKIFQNVTK